MEINKQYEHHGGGRGRVEDNFRDVFSLQLFMFWGDLWVRNMATSIGIIGVHPGSTRTSQMSLDSKHVSPNSVPRLVVNRVAPESIQEKDYSRKNPNMK